MKFIGPLPDLKISDAIVREHHKWRARARRWTELKSWKVLTVSDSVTLTMKYKHQGTIMNFVIIQTSDSLTWWIDDVKIDSFENDPKNFRNPENLMSYMKRQVFMRTWPKIDLDEKHYHMSVQVMYIRRARAERKVVPKSS